MSLNVGVVSATAELNMRRFSQGMGQMRKQGASSSADVQKSLGGIGTRLTSIAFLAKTALGSALVMGARRAINEFALLEGSMAKFNVVFADQSKEMERWVGTIRERMPLANREIIAAAASMQDLLVPMGIAREQATGMTKEWLELAASLAAFNDVPVDQALEAIRSGIAGQSRPLRAFGIDARETAIQQTALAAGLLKTGEVMTEQVRQQALLLRAYDQSKDAVDGYEDQLGSTLIMEQNLNATYKDTLAVLGEGLNPSYVSLLQNMVKVLEITKELSGATSWLAKNFGRFDFVSKTIFNVAGSMADASKETRQFAESLKSALAGDLDAEGVGKVMKTLGEEINTLETNIAKLGDGVIKDSLQKELDTLLFKVHSLANVLQFMALNAGVDDIIPSVSQDELDSLERARKALADIRSEMSLTSPSDVIMDFGEDAITRANLHMEMFGSTFDEAMKSVRSTTPDWEAFMDVVWDSADATNEFSHRLEIAGDAIDSTGDALKDSTGAARFFSTTLGDGLQQVLFQAQSVEDALKNIIKQLASRALVTGLMALFSGGLPAGKNFGKAMFGGTFHTGGIVGGTGEKTIIAKGGEGVFTPAQMKAMGSSGGGGSAVITINVKGDTQLRAGDLRFIVDEQIRQSVRLQ